MTQTQERIDFRANSRRVPANITAATQKNAHTAIAHRAAVVDPLGDEYWQALRQAAHDLRLHAMLHLDQYLPLLEENVVRAGGRVHWAVDAAEARQIVRDIAASHDARRIVKVKSMATEEIELNHALQSDGRQVLETDLGEYIVQMAGVKPSHIIAPALHMTKEDIAALFRDKLKVDAPPDPQVLTEIARTRLRQEFLAADMGISGGNFLIAETGTLVLVTNEGNGRMCTTLPPIHTAIVGIDKGIPSWQSLTVLLKLLARSATGQKMSAYVSFVTGIADEGPREFHLVLLDNGRTRILQDAAARETLLCIRCGACLNACPVYNQVGGHAYGGTYPGPIGAILSPQLLGIAIAGDLPFASSLCGACAEICPVKIPIPEILLHLRRRVVEGDPAEGPAVPFAPRAIGSLAARALASRTLYRVGARGLQIIQTPLRREGWLFSLPPPLNRWTMARPLPAFRSGLRAWWKKRSDGRTG
ncbi:MAG: LutB/LldF family L-lactate oxidation iron-sulfur protein [Chloroflexi bacterium]|nr:LutB/LldF family L-lactate oxidation iron-sulfur protein [Chloroflexota bacterium]